jgi:hypothetical protein
MRLSLVVFRIHSRSHACSQVLAKQSIQWHNSYTNCAIDGAQPVVRCDCSVFRVHSVSRAYSQVLVQQSIDWHNSDTNCAIDKALQLVSRDCSVFRVHQIHAPSQVLVQKSPHRINSSVEFDN